MNLVEKIIDQMMQEGEGGWEQSRASKLTKLIEKYFIDSQPLHLVSQKTGFGKN